MLRDDLFTMLAQRLGNRTDLIARMPLEAQFIQENVLERHIWTPWFLETEMAYTDTTPNDERLSLPVDFIAEVEDQALWRYAEGETEDLIPLKKMPYDDLLRKYPGAGVPLAYAIGASYFFLGHIPDMIYVMKMRYYARDENLSTNIENKWLRYASAVFLAELGVVMAEKHMQHFELAKVFRADAAAAWNVLYSIHVSRMEVNQSRVMEA